MNALKQAASRLWAALVRILGGGPAGPRPPV